MSLIQRFKNWLETFKPCYKESIGYTCYHRTYQDGTKECGNAKD